MNVPRWLIQSWGWGLALTLSSGAAIAAPLLTRDSPREATLPLAPQLAQATFSDIEGNLYQGDIVRAATLGFIAGPGDGTFLPNDTVTREQAVSIILSALGVEDSQLGNASSRFRDVPRDRWSARKITYAADNNIVSGYADGTFQPSQSVTRAELMAMVRQVADRHFPNRAQQPTFAFVDTTNHWAGETIAYLSGYCNIATPLNERGVNFAPNIGATRAFTAAVIVRLHDCGEASTPVPAEPAQPETVSPPPVSGAGVAIADSFALDIVAAHNRYRAEVGAVDLTWSPNLAATAQTWANQLAAENRFYHSDRSQRQGAGENLATGGPPGAFSPTALVDLWGAEQQYFIPGQPFSDRISNTGRWQDVGHYTQIIWRTTTEVGCGLATTPSRDILVCHYNPPGNVLNQVP